MAIFARHGINVSYTYSLISTYIAVCVEDIEGAEEALKDEPVEFATLEGIATRLS